MRAEKLKEAGGGGWVSGDLREVAVLDAFKRRPTAAKQQSVGGLALLPGQRARRRCDGQRRCMLGPKSPFIRKNLRHGCNGGRAATTSAVPLLHAGQEHIRGAVGVTLVFRCSTSRLPSSTRGRSTLDI